MSNVDLAMLLYLNPELVANSNLATLTLAQSAWTADQSGSRSLVALSSAQPIVPTGFDPKVYVAAQTNVSLLNQTIFRAMVGVGISSNSILRQGVYVSTLMEEVALTYNSNNGTLLGMQLTASEIGNEPFRFTACNLNSGDYVRMQRKTDGKGTNGVVLYGQVTTVTSGSNFVLSPTSPAAFNADAIGCVYTLSGIRMWDIKRQALVSYSRNTAAYSNALSIAGGNTSNQTSFPGYVNSNDVVPRSDFNLAAYRAMYPDVQMLDFSDAYLDYRLRGRRANEYRLVNGDDLYNLEAPYASNAVAGYGTTGFNASFSNNLTVGGNLGIGMPCTGAEGYSGEIDAWQGANAWWMVAGSNTRLAVAGDIFATGTVISLSDARVKSSIEPIDNPLGRLSFLKGYTYAVDGSAKRQTGLLAQEVEEAIPEAVFYRSSEGILVGEKRPIASVAYGNLAGLFVSAINELSERLSAIERRLDAA